MTIDELEKSVPGQSTEAALFRERMDDLVQAVLSVTSGLELEPTLRQIVDGAMNLVGARYGALAVLGDGGMFERFVQQGIDSATQDALGPLPTGYGLLGVAVEEQGALRLTELSQHAASVGFPPHHPPMRSLLAVPMMSCGVAYGRLYLAEKRDQQPFTEDDEILVRGLAAAAGASVANAQLYEQGQRRERWLEATGEVTGELLAGTDIKDALLLIAGHAHELTGADYTLIAIPQNAAAAAWEITELTVVVCVGEGAEAVTGRAIPLVGSTTGAVFGDHVPRSVKRLAFHIAEGLGVEFGPALAMPLGLGKSVSGVMLAVREPGSAAFDEHALRLVATFANHAALALRDAENESIRRDLRLLADRDRIARDMHDQVLQRLYGVGLSMQSTEQRIQSPELAARITDHLNKLQQITSEVRTAIYDLSPDPVGTAPLRTSLRAAITELTADAPMQITVGMSGQLDRVPAEVAQQAESAMREAISNAVRHSEAAELVVTISVDDELVIDVRDNGVGIADGVTPSGLDNMQVRAAEVGGSCTIAAADGGGTRVRWTAPLP